MRGMQKGLSWGDNAVGKVLTTQVWIPRAHIKPGSVARSVTPGLGVWAAEPGKSLELTGWPAPVTWRAPGSVKDAVSKNKVELDNGGTHL